MRIYDSKLASLVEFVQLTRKKTCAIALLMNSVSLINSVAEFN